MLPLSCPCILVWDIRSAQRHATLCSLLCLQKIFTANHCFNPKKETLHSWWLEHMPDVESDLDWGPWSWRGEDSLQWLPTWEEKSSSKVPVNFSHWVPVGLISLNLRCWKSHINCCTKACFPSRVVANQSSMSSIVLWRLARMSMVPMRSRAKPCQDLHTRQHASLSLSKSKSRIWPATSSGMLFRISIIYLTASHNCSAHCAHILILHIELAWC